MLNIKENTFEETLSSVETFGGEFVVAERADQFADKQVCSQPAWRLPGAHVHLHYLHGLAAPLGLLQVLQTGNRWNTSVPGWTT